MSSDFIAVVKNESVNVSDSSNTIENSFKVFVLWEYERESGRQIAEKTFTNLINKKIQF